jgi:hypothetical protein
MKQDKNRLEKLQARLSRTEYSQRISNPNRNLLLYTITGFLSSPILLYFRFGAPPESALSACRSRGNVPLATYPLSKKPKNGRGTQRKRQIDRELPLFSGFARTLLSVLVL